MLKIETYKDITRVLLVKDGNKFIMPKVIVIFESIRKRQGTKEDKNASSWRKSRLNYKLNDF